MKIINDEIQPLDYMYMIGDNNGHIKVGISKDPNKRIKELQTGHPNDLVLLFTEEFECERNHLLKIERLIHRELRRKNYKMRGEWFTVPDSDIEDVKNIIRYNRIRYEADTTYFKFHSF